jgi:dolichyl-phosphate beta-glucosyltransferase
MSTRKIELSVVVPCHNSELTISNTFETLESVLPDASEIVFVENGSTDNTFRVLLELSNKGVNENIQVKVITSDKGLGNALRSGILESSGKKVAFIADDLPFGHQEIEFAPLVSEDKNQIIAISKYLPDSEYRTSFSRRILGAAFIILRKKLLNTKIKDTQGSFVGQGDLLRHLAGETKEKEFLITTEIYLLAEIYSIEINEIPCKQSIVRPRPSTVSIKSVTNMAFGLIRLKIRLSKL